jgi:hypothetical protein
MKNEEKALYFGIFLKSKAKDIIKGVLYRCDISMYPEKEFQVLNEIFFSSNLKFFM